VKQDEKKLEPFRNQLNGSSFYWDWLYGAVVNNLTAEPA
jgi:hypothetical protein